MMDCGIAYQRIAESGAPFNQPIAPSLNHSMSVINDGKPL